MKLFILATLAALVIGCGSATAELTPLSWEITSMAASGGFYIEDLSALSIDFESGTVCGVDNSGQVWTFELERDSFITINSY